MNQDQGQDGAAMEEAGQGEEEVHWEEVPPTETRSVSLRAAEIMGLEVPMVEVEVHCSSGLPQLDVVGLADPCVRESRQRIRAAITACGYAFPDDRITINLAPARLRKMGTGLDLPMAIGILMSGGILRIPAPRQGAVPLHETLLLGELALSGALRPVPGVLGAALAARAAGIRTMIVPRESAAEAALVENLTVLGADSLLDVALYLEGRTELPVQLHRATLPEAPPDMQIDFRSIRGQSLAKRALLVAAAGGHNALMVGPPGAGKTLLARAFPDILPDLDREAAVEVTRLYSAAGLSSGPLQLIRRPPFRAPHHSLSDAGLIGGGRQLSPGEITLAHHGVLFLDELPEFRRNVLEVLREPLESGHIVLARAGGMVRYPAQIQLLAAMNPCPCGFSGSAFTKCRCTAQRIRQYQQRISGPLLDRIDIRLHLQPIPTSELLGSTAKEAFSTEDLRAQATKARERQRARLHGSGVDRNARIPADQIEKYCGLSAVPRRVLDQAAAKSRASGRAVHRILRMARTIADLQNQEEIPAEAVYEALSLWQPPTD